MTTLMKAASATRLVHCDPPEIADSLLIQLREHLTSRRIADGIRLFQQNAGLLQTLQPSQPNAACLVGALAEWVDIGFERPALVREALARFGKTARARLALSDYMNLRLAEGMLALSEELEDDAIAHLDSVLTIGADLGERETLAIAHFWKGRCLRKKGEYDASLLQTIQGRDLALELGHPAMAAVMQVMESWLLFQKGRTGEASSTLQQAYSVLRHTDDHVTLGNIHSSYGRMARRNGQQQQAMEHFQRAIAEYKKRDCRHRNLARTLANIALAERYIALELRNKIDSAAQRQRRRPTASASLHARRKTDRVADIDTRSANAALARYRARMEQLRSDAFAHLDEAAAIYGNDPNYHGAGSVHINRGYLHLDTGDFDCAESEAAAALSLAEQRRDTIVMARARLLECMVDNAKVEEEIGDGADPGRHARHALDCAREAIELARHTENRRLLATAYVWQGLTLCNSFFDDCEAARQSCEQAVALLKGLPGSTLEDLHTLKKRLARSGSVDPTLRAWSEGSLGEKTFQQITEEFADIVIPKVWEREGRKVSRVAIRLSISPKKVRRILARTGRRPQG